MNGFKKQGKVHVHKISLIEMTSLMELVQLPLRFYDRDFCARSTSSDYPQEIVWRKDQCHLQAIKMEFRKPSYLGFNKTRRQYWFFWLPRSIIWFLRDWDVPIMRVTEPSLKEKWKWFINRACLILLEASHVCFSRYFSRVARISLESLTDPSTKLKLKQVLRMLCAR